MPTRADDGLGARDQALKRLRIGPRNAAAASVVVVVGRAMATSQRGASAGRAITLSLCAFLRAIGPGTTATPRPRATRSSSVCTSLTSDATVRLIPAAANPRSVVLREPQLVWKSTNGRPASS